MKTETVVYCVVALLLGMLLANMLKNVCGCKTVEGASGWNCSNVCDNVEDYGGWGPEECKSDCDDVDWEASEGAQFTKKLMSHLTFA